MPRINVEDSIYRNDGFFSLSLELKNKRHALGLMIDVWKLAQKHYLSSPHGRIPKAEWNDPEFKLVIKHGLAIEDEYGIYVKGSNEQFGWLKKCSEKGKLGQQRKEEIKNKEKLTNVEIIEESPKGKERVAKGSETSSSFSSSVSKKNTYMSSCDDEREVVSSILFNLWNEHRPRVLSEAIKNTQKRKQAASARWRETPSTEYWISVIQRIGQSKFCLGEVGQGWKADYDWFICPDNHIRVLEGKYDDKKKQVRKFELVEACV